jgi:hypothetical protein
MSNYYVLNFNDNISGLGTLYVLLLVNNMQVITDGFTTIREDISVKTFFVCWYALGVLFLLNLLTASLLSSFLSFWVLQKKIIYQQPPQPSHSHSNQSQEILNPIQGDGNSDVGTLHAQQSGVRECAESHHSFSHQQQTEISIHTLDLPSGSIQGNDPSLTRGRSQTVTLNSMDDTLQWFRFGSAVWEGEEIDTKRSKPGLFLNHCVSDLLEGSFHHPEAIPIRDTQVNGGGFAEISTLSALPSLREVMTTCPQIVTRIPFAPTPSSMEEDFEYSSERHHSEESFRGEATLRLSTQFIDSRKGRAEETHREVYRPSEMRGNHLRETETRKEPVNQRSLARQWKVCLCLFPRIMMC